MIQTSPVMLPLSVAGFALRRWASGIRMGTMTDSSANSPAPVPMELARKPSAHGHSQPCPSTRIPITVSARATGTVTSSHASWRPRTSTRSTPGFISVSHSALPSALYRFADDAAAMITSATPAQGR